MTIVSNPQTLDLSDIQGTVLRGYGKLMNTGYLFLEVTDGVKARDWLKAILAQVGSADPASESQAPLSLAFTPAGLRAIGLSETNVENFPSPFREGINTDNRNRVLGDFGENAPENWRWGGGREPLHILLMMHAKDKPAADALIERQKQALQKNGGLKLLRLIHGYQREDSKEPFGFHDGISQPTVKGSGRPGPANNLIETGEFLLGYKDEYGLYPYSPLITEDQGNLSILQSDPNGSGNKDLGRNGTFMVYRQIEQHVDRFWKFFEEKTRNPDGSANSQASALLAAKAIGRWPSGASLVNFPDADPGGNPSNDDFGYADKDPHGLKCPFGSHLRRNNPRDSFRWYNKKQSLKITRRHRIIRRGRTYELDPEKDGVDHPEIGLLFICFNTNFQMQYEFIQHAWSNSNQPRFLTNDPDVAIGVPAKGDPGGAGQFTVQAEPVNQFVDGLQPFITIRGGEYFFVPSLSALQYLSTL